jgi:sugar phosphate permease
MKILTFVWFLNGKYYMLTHEEVITNVALNLSKNSTKTGVFQSPSWPPVAILMTRWYSFVERGYWWAVMSTATTSGGALTSLAIGWSVARGGVEWRTSLLTVTAFGLTMALVWLYRLPLYPSECDVDPHARSETKRRSTPTKSTTTPTATTATLSLSKAMQQVLSSRIVWFYGIVSLLQYFTRDVLINWFAMLMSNERGTSDTTTGALLLAMELGGVPGCLLAAIVSRVTTTIIYLKISQNLFNNQNLHFSITMIEII